MDREYIWDRLEMLKIDKVELHFRALREWLEAAPEEDLRAFQEELSAFELRIGWPIQEDRLQEGDPVEIKKAHALGYYTLGLGMAYQLRHDGTQV